MKVLALVYPGMTLLDLVGPLQAWSFLPDYEVQYVWHRPGTVLTDCGLGVQATHSFEDAWTDPDVLFVGGGARPTLDLLGDSVAIAFLADRGTRARWVCSVCTGSLILGAAGLLRGYRAAVHWGAREALSQFGAESSSERVCVDRNRLTGGGLWSTHRSPPTGRAALNWQTRRPSQRRARCCSRRCRVQARSLRRSQFTLRVLTTRV